MITWARVCQRIDQLLLGHDDDRPVTAEETRRAEGTQHAQTPGEESGDSPAAPPSPGDLSVMPDSEFLTGIAAALDQASGHAPTVLEITHLLNLADAARDRAAQFAAFEP